MKRSRDVEADDDQQQYQQQQHYHQYGLHQTTDSHQSCTLHGIESPSKRGGSAQLQFDPKTFRLVPRPVYTSQEPALEAPKCASCRNLLDPVNSWVCCVCSNMICRLCCVPREQVRCLDCTAIS